MNDIWELPTSINIGGREWEIRTDYRVIVDILIKLNDPDYDDDEKRFIALDAFYVGFSEFLSEDSLRIFMPIERQAEAMKAEFDFIDLGQQNDDQAPKPRLMDWEQDARIIIPSINRVLGKEIRTLPYLHWWTFMGAYMEIGRSLYSDVISIRSKKAKGKKLEKWEREFYKENKATIDLKQRYSEEELEEQKRLLELLG